MDDTSDGGLSHLYEDPQWVANQLVEIAYDGSSAGRGLRDAFECLMATGDVQHEDIDEDGSLTDPPVVVPPSELPAWGPDAHQASLEGYGAWPHLEDDASKTRAQELVDGAEPRIGELLNVARAIVSDAQENTDAWDRFYHAGYYRLVGSGGREAWVVGYSRGFSFTIVEYDLDGPFTTREAARSAIRARGFTSPDEVTSSNAKRMLRPKMPSADGAPAADR